MIKKILTILILSLSFITSSDADDIREFQIEGMSVGDSVLDFFSKKEIEKFSVNYAERVDYKYSQMEIFEKKSSYRFNLYDAIVIAFKAKDSQFSIVSVSGVILYENKIKDCYKKMNEVESEISKLFSSVKAKKNDISRGPLGTLKKTFFQFSSGDEITIKCINYDEDKYVDHLRIGVSTKNYTSWVRNKAY